MPENKICIFRCILPDSVDNICTGSMCSFWSPEFSMCCILLGVNSLISISDGIRGLSENIKNHFPE